MWDPIEHRLALLELVARGQLRARQRQADAFAWLAELPWTRTSTRRDELVLVENRRADLEALLDQVWPDWREALAELSAAGLQATERGWKEHLDRQLVAELPPLPERLNLHTATAQVTTHSKAALSETSREALDGVDVTRDGIVRVRPNPGLALVRAGRVTPAAELVELVGELVISERAFADGTTLGGTLPAAVLLVENLGPYLDLAPPERWLVAHVPGWNTLTIKLLLAHIPAHVLVVHFGDLDPNGVRIFRHLRAFRSDLRWFVPELWRDYFDRALPREWPDDLPVDDTPLLVRELAHLGLWLEQETIVLDARLRDALAAVM